MTAHRGRGAATGVKGCRTHPRGCGFRFDRKRKAIYHVASKRTLPGLLTATRSAFFPRYSYEGATHDTIISHTFNSTMGHPSFDPPSGSGRRWHSKTLDVGRGRALRRGHRLDVAMQVTTGYFKKYKLSHDFFFSEAARLTFAVENLPAKVRLYCDSISPEVAVCWKALAARSLSPVACQVVVGCTTLGRGTLIDMVCRDALGRFVVVELKSGFSTYYYKWTGNFMATPFESQTDCPFNQHQLQLLIGTELYRRSFWPNEPFPVSPPDAQSKLGTPVLIRIRVGEDGSHHADTHELRPWSIKELPRALSRLSRLN